MTKQTTSRKANPELWGKLEQGRIVLRTTSPGDRHTFTKLTKSASGKVRAAVKRLDAARTKSGGQAYLTDSLENRGRIVARKRAQAFDALVTASGLAAPKVAAESPKNAAPKARARKPKAAASTKAPALNAGVPSGLTPEAIEMLNTLAAAGFVLAPASK